MTPLYFLHNSHLTSTHTTETLSGALTTYLCPTQPYWSQLVFYSLSFSFFSFVFILQLHKTLQGWKVNPMRGEDYQVVHSEPLVLMENAALSSQPPRTLLHSNLRVFSSWCAHLHTDKVTLKLLRPVAAKRHLTLQKEHYKSKPPGVNSPASGSKRLISLDLRERERERKSRCVSGSTSIQQTTRVESTGAAVEVFTAPWRERESEGEKEREGEGTVSWQAVWEERRGEETVTECRRKPLTGPNTPPAFLFLGGGSYRGNLWPHVKLGVERKR